MDAVSREIGDIENDIGFEEEEILNLENAWNELRTILVALKEELAKAKIDADTILSCEVGR